MSNALPTESSGVPEDPSWDVSKCDILDAQPIIAEFHQKFLNLKQLGKETLIFQHNLKLR